MLSERLRLLPLEVAGPVLALWLGFRVSYRLERGSSELGEVGEDSLEDRIVRGATCSQADNSDSLRSDFEG